jgi:hypothetical protein
VQLRLDLAQDQLVLLQDLRDVGAQLARLRIDDLVLFLDADGQGRRLSCDLLRGSTTNVARLEPPPASR